MSQQVTFKGCVTGGKGKASTSVWFPDQEVEQAARVVNGGSWLYVPDSQLMGVVEGTGIAEDEVTVTKWWADKVGLTYDEDQLSREE